jgi:tRNA nucleotidyltransferase (CCA-adding enzyme)
MQPWRVGASRVLLNSFFSMYPDLHPTRSLPSLHRQTKTFASREFLDDKSERGHFEPPSGQLQEKRQHVSQIAASSSLPQDLPVATRPRLEKFSAKVVMFVEVKNLSIINRVSFTLKPIIIKTPTF